MLKIYPFQYGLKIQQIYENGSTYSPDALDITEEEIMAGFMAATQKIAAMSLAVEIPTVASVPHIMANTIKSLIAMAIATEYDLKEARQMREYLADPSKFASVAVAAPVAVVAAAPVKEAAKEESDSGSEEGSDIGMGLFD